MPLFRIGLAVVTLLLFELIGRISMRLKHLFQLDQLTLLAAFFLCCIAFSAWTLFNYPHLDIQRNKTAQLVIICSLFGLTIGIASHQ